MADYRKIVSALITFFCASTVFFCVSIIAEAVLLNYTRTEDKKDVRYLIKICGISLGVSVFLFILSKYIYNRLPGPPAPPPRDPGVHMNPLLIQQLQNAARRDPVVIPFPANLTGENNVDPITLNRYEVNKTYVELPKARGTNQKFYVNRDQAIEMFTQRVVSLFDDQKIFTPNNVRVVKFSLNE